MNTVTASTYGDVDIFQETTPLQCWTDENRPVRLRGSLFCVYRKHANSWYGTCANGWAELVMERYLRRVRYTSFNAREVMKTQQRIMIALGKKHRLTYHAYRIRVMHDSCYLNGSPHYLQEFSCGELRVLKGMAKAILEVGAIERKQRKIKGVLNQSTIEVSE